MLNASFDACRGRPRPCARASSRLLAPVRQIRLGQRLDVGWRHELAADRRLSTSSALPPTSVAITGRPLAIASRMVLEMPSASEGSTKQSRPRMTSARRCARRAARPARQAGRVEQCLAFAPQRTVADHDQAQRGLQLAGTMSSAPDEARARRVWSLTVCMRPTVPTSQCSGRQRAARKAACGPPAESARYRRRCRSRSLGVRHADRLRQIVGAGRATGPRNGSRRA